MGSDSVISAVLVSGTISTVAGCTFGRLPLRGAFVVAVSTKSESETFWAVVIFWRMDCAFSAVGSFAMASLQMLRRTSISESVNKISFSSVLAP